MKSISVKTNLVKGQKLDSGFNILDVVELEELNAIGIWAKHDKSGAEVFHVLNDDEENLFSFGFTTFPNDSTGAAHILEHSVLCGSQRYPLKDAFIVLAQGSLQTFLNAITFPDKTVYPASSINEHDYFNLMSVYGDAVFRPLIPEWTFMQEGHRYEFKDNKLTITGVVYNEMKGAYSSLDTYAGLWSVKAVMPDTPYALESGGDPVQIPKLTYDALKEFHRTRYSPANCRVFLAGNIPTEKQLAFLDKEFFNSIESGKACDPVKKTEKWNEPRKFNIPCPAGNESKCTVFLSWLCSDVTDTNENLALAALTEILLGHDGSPLTRKLIESGLGEDITPVSGLESEIRETVFVAGLKGVKSDASEGCADAKRIEELIMSELKRLATEGIPQEEIEAALLAIEFSQREIKRSGGPFSLVWMRRSLRTWIHGTKPWEGILLMPALEKIKQNLSNDKKYFESLIKKYLIDNPHRALVILEPKEDFLPKQEEQLAEELADIEKNLSESERHKIEEDSKKLEIIQSEADTQEALASIPHLSRSDLIVADDIISRRHENLSGIPALCHELFTNGITYTDMAFPVDILPSEDKCWLPFFAKAIISVGLPGMDYGEVSGLLARTAGGFNSLLHTGSAVKNSRYLQTAAGDLDLSGRDWIIFRLKCLDEKIAPSLDLALRLISEADFTDLRRLNDLVLEMKNQIDSSLAPMGHMYASSRASRRNSHCKETEELWNGLSQIDFIHRLAKMDTAAISEKLINLREKIASTGMIANLTGTALDTAGAEFAKRFGRFGVPAERPDTGNINQISANINNDKIEVFASSSLQVGFASKSFNSAAFDTIQQTAETVLAHQFTTGILWEEIRMKGGAYGAFLSSDAIENSVSFATYRDPDPMRSLETVSALLKDGSFKDCDEDYLVKSLIGCYAKLTRPRTSAESGMLDLFRFLYNVDNDYKKRNIQRLINMRTADISAAFTALGSREPTGKAIIAGIKTAEEAAKVFGVDVQMLPV